MTGGDKNICPFCIAENHLDARVCTHCHRDIIVPVPLRTEHRELSHKREQLRLELERVKARLASRDGWRFGIR
jgi:ribosomal protein L40E